jgi:aryl-alcohol dehydrogenase-like predicted oxidoreductase
MLEYIDRIIIGGWQLATGHNQDSQNPLQVIEAYYKAGFRAFDCADIYTGVEETLGIFIKTHGIQAQDIKIHTKYVPDLAALPTLDKSQTEAIIDRSRTRLGLDTLDLVQFHWWDYDVPRYLATLHTLSELKAQGKIHNIGLTNFDAVHVKEIVQAGITIASIQTQYSILDRRPKAELAPLAKQHDIAILGYGSVAGGLLSKNYLGKPPLSEPLENRSLVKYMLMVEEMGGWSNFQMILEGLQTISTKTNSDISSVACAYMLKQDAVKACIIGARNTRHLEEHIKLRDSLKLTNEQVTKLEILRSRFPEIPGAVYQLERDIGGKHGRIMKYNLNKNTVKS